MKEKIVRLSEEGVGGVNDRRTWESDTKFPPLQFGKGAWDTWRSVQRGWVVRETWICEGRE